jgi:hypothetical protein
MIDGTVSHPIALDLFIAVAVPEFMRQQKMLPFLKRLIDSPD